MQHGLRLVTPLMDGMSDDPEGDHGALMQKLPFNSQGSVPHMYAWGPNEASLFIILAVTSAI